jgi:hypothetical protein
MHGNDRESIRASCRDGILEVNMPGADRDVAEHAPHHRGVIGSSSGPVEPGRRDGTGQSDADSISQNRASSA